MTRRRRRAVAERAGDGWRLSGVKTAVPAARRGRARARARHGDHGWARHIRSVWRNFRNVGRASARHSGTARADVPRRAGGSRCHRAAAGTDGHRERARARRAPAAWSSTAPSLTTAGCSANRARRGDVAGWLVARYTVGLCATQAGVVARALELTAEYARSREQFGRPIGSFQAVAQRLADAYVDVEAVWLTMWQAAWLLAARPAGRPGGRRRGRHRQVLGRRRGPPGRAHRRPRARRDGHRHVVPRAPVLHRGQAGRVHPWRRHGATPPPRRPHRDRGARPGRTVRAAPRPARAGVARSWPGTS